MGGLTSALMTTTIVFMAVFIPVKLHGLGMPTGTFYTQFGNLPWLLLVAISLLNAMTLSPALCALILRPRADAASGEYADFLRPIRMRLSTVRSAAYSRNTCGACPFCSAARQSPGLGSTAAACGVLVWLMSITKTGLVPQEGHGYDQRGRADIARQQFLGRDRPHSLD